MIMDVRSWYSSSDSLGRLYEQYSEAGYIIILYYSNFFFFSINYLPKYRVDRITVEIILTKARMILLFCFKPHSCTYMLVNFASMLLSDV